MTHPHPDEVPIRPLDSARHPFEVFVLFLGLVTGLPLLWGAPVPGSTTELLGPALAHVWAWILVLGCLCALTGAWWTWWAWLGRWWARIRPTPVAGLLIEQVGLVAVGVGTGIYAIGVIVAAGDEHVIPAGIVGAFGLACWWRVAQIQRWVGAAVRGRR